MTTFFTADWHLGASDMWLMGRPFVDRTDMYTRILAEHNSVVNNGDTVYVLGDVLHEGDLGLLPLFDEFNGDLVLVRGNHDRRLSSYFISRYFVDAVDEGAGIELDVDGLPCWLTHYPTQARADRFNLVGHIHDRWKVQKNMLNVGVDVHHFQPVSEDRVGFYRRAIRDFYDQDVWVADHPANTAHDDRGAPGTYLDQIRSRGEAR